MLTAHMSANEAKLLAISQIPANAGHSLHKGTPREAFIGEFLKGHLSERVAVGSGEIIDSSSVPNPPATNQRSQFDIVIYKRDYPKLDIGGGISAFLAESVVATIEVKSTLTEEDVDQAIGAARYAKSLVRRYATSFSAGFQPPSILNYVVAYGGPARMHTVHGWLKRSHNRREIPDPELPIDSHGRSRFPSPSLDGIFVLGKGFELFDNFPIGFISDDVRSANPTHYWTIGDTMRGSLLLLFTHLTYAIAAIPGSWLDPVPYLARFNVPDVVLER